VTQFGVGGDFHWNNVQARLMTQFGMYSQTTPRNDASPARGQWQLADAYRYISEAYGGYHWDVWDGINVQAGIFMSYIGLFSYYNFDNWAYQRVLQYAVVFQRHESADLSQRAPED
jgi:Putative beta-barrel porin-2, OmpL-like. bbp2